LRARAQIERGIRFPSSRTYEQCRRRDDIVVAHRPRGRAFASTRSQQAVPLNQLRNDPEKILLLA
jgi:hypothetical protein